MNPHTNTKKLENALIFSERQAFLLFLAYLGVLYSIYLETNFLSSELTKSQDLMNQYGLLESILLIALIGPIIEEFCFRYVLFKLFAPINVLIILALSSSLWAALHFSENLLVPIMLFFLGWILGVLRIQSGSILYPTIVHALNNLIFIFFLRVTI